MNNRKTSLYSGRTKTSSMASCCSMQSINSKSSSPYLNSLSSYNQFSEMTIVDLQKELKEKDTTILSLQQRIDELLTTDKPKPQSPDYLLKLIKKGDQKLQELQKQVEVINQENESLLFKQKELVTIIGKYKKENSELRLLTATKKPTGLEDLNEKIDEIEKLHVKLIKDNSELKSEIARLKGKEEEVIDLKLSVLAGEIYKVRTEVSQLLKVFKLIQSGQDPDLTILLQHRVEDQRFLENSYKICNSFVLAIRREIDEIKQIISDMKAEYCASSCITQ
jgi:chromosome segregation ATPase